MDKSLYDKLGEQRKEAQIDGDVPQWYSTSGYQLFNDKYLYKANNVREQFERIASTAAKHLSHIGKEELAYNKFFEMLWNGWLSPSTPVLANMGTDRGLPVSCSGGYIDDSVDGFYTSRHEAAILTKYGFGTSGYLGDIRPRGSDISVGGKASGVLPVFRGFVSDMRDISQGGVRRGSWAGYLPIEHDDFYELVDHVTAEPDDANVGWIVSDEFIKKLNDGDEEAINRYQRAMKMKMVTGKGYFFKVDAANRNKPQIFKDLEDRDGATIKASNLCSEISLPSDDNHTFTCVLSSMNLAKYDEWKDSDVIFWATIFLDCVAEEFIQRARNTKGLEKAVRFTEKSRSLGLGVCGFHTYLQKNMIPFESFDAHMWNSATFKHISDESLRATEWMAEQLGEPEWCTGYGVRNAVRMAIAPTKSTALIMGGVSEGINPDPAMAFTQLSAGGEMQRINPVLLDIMKERNVFNKKTVRDIIDKFGSVQHVEWLNGEEKEVFKTAFEINQEAVVRLASARQLFVDQTQSVNLFFSADEDPAWISHIHKLAFDDERLISLYYIYTMAGVHGSKECESCQ